jgi:hypothetical protein
MVIPLAFDVIENIEDTGMYVKKYRARITKAVLIGVLDHWHDQYMDKHFESSAYSEYPGKYPHRKRSTRRKYGKANTREPFVMSGGLRDRMMDRGKFRQSIKATAKGATASLDVGRPPKYDKEFLDMMILKAMFEMSIPDYAKARTKVYASYGYGRKNMLAFQKGISATNEQEREEMAEEMAYLYHRESKKAGRLRTRKTVKG